MSSMAVGSIPNSNGFKTLMTIASIISPLPEQEPIPVTPSSVSICTSVANLELRTPERLKTRPSGGISARRRIVLTSVIFIRLLHLPELSVYHFAVYHYEVDFLIRSPVALAVDANNFR